MDIVISADIEAQVRKYMRLMAEAELEAAQDLYNKYACHDWADVSQERQELITQLSLAKQDYVDGLDDMITSMLSNPEGLAAMHRAMVPFMEK